ncbi:MAG: inositol monophosphatase, partial [Candidatus Micrarchaeota archaeon]|nr:inositol monophosphatase [Candidatus Micrarchaeota archaeon]
MGHLSDAIRAAKASGKLLGGLFSHGDFEMEYKSRKEIVTSADLSSEKLLIGYLRERYPEHRIVSEESGAAGGKSSEFTWYVDPLDGTSNFYRHIPYFNVSIALERNGKLVCGVVYNPMIDELFCAEVGKGAFLNGQRIRPSQNNELAKAFITSCHGRGKEEIDAFLKLMGQFKYKAQDMRKLGSAALELCYVACGRADAFIGYGIRPWDFKGGLIIAQESGCKVGGILQE